MRAAPCSSREEGACISEQRFLFAQRFHSHQVGGVTSVAKTKASSSKRTKPEPKTAQEEETDYSKAKRALATTEPAKKKKKKRQAKVDSHITTASMYEVEGDWDCMLNQTNIGQNNNKYYVIQLLRRQGSHPPM